MDTQTSQRLFERARGVMPGGVSSPVRAFKSVGGAPLFFQRGEGARVWDADGNAFIDYVGSWGPLIVGHAHPAVVAAATARAAKGSTFGAPCAEEVELAEEIRRRVPSMERVRFVSSGTEATMSAIRLARAATGRRAVVKFDGCYHGHADALLVKAGSGVATLGLPDSPGVPEELARLTYTLPFNDLPKARALFSARGGEIAAAILEPVVGNMGVLLPEPGFLEELARIVRGAGALLILDEVMTGFRLAPGGASEKYGVVGDLCTVGKVMGGGYPAAAYGGRAALMTMIAPEGPVYQAGTLSGNPVAMAAGLATLRLLDAGAYAKLEETSAALCAGIADAASAAGVPFTLNRAGSMWTLFFCEGPVKDAAGARRADTARFARWHKAMLARGVYLPPSQFEAAFVSTAHGPREVEETIAAARAALREVAP